MGNGFPLDRAAPEQAPHLFIFATGTGISPIKALIESGELQVMVFLPFSLICISQAVEPNFVMLTLVHDRRQTKGNQSGFTMGLSILTAQRMGISLQNGRRAVSRYAFV